MPATPFRRKVYWLYRSSNFTAGTVLWDLVMWDWGYAGWHVWFTPWLPGFRISADWGRD